MKGADETRRPAIVRTTLEALYAFMHLLAPVLPMAAQEGTYSTRQSGGYLNDMKNYVISGYLNVMMKSDDIILI